MITHYTIRTATSDTTLRSNGFGVDDANEAHAGAILAAMDVADHIAGCAIVWELLRGGIARGTYLNNGETHRVVVVRRGDLDDSSRMARELAWVRA